MSIHTFIRGIKKWVDVRLRYLRTNSQGIYWAIHSFRYLAAAGVGVFFEKISDGGWAMILGGTFVLLVCVIMFHSDLIRAKRVGMSVFFWRLVFTALCFVVAAWSCEQWNKSFYGNKILDLQTRLEFTNSFYRDFTNNLSHQIDGKNDTINELRLAFAGKPHAESDAELMGLEILTNYISATNFVPITITNIIALDGSISNEPFVLDFFQMQRIKSKLDGISGVPLKVVCPMNDIPAVILSKQVTQIFQAAGFPVKLFGDTGGKYPFNGMTVCVKTLPTGALHDAFVQIFQELIQRQQWDYETSYSSNEIWIAIKTIKK